MIQPKARRRPLRLTQALRDAQVARTVFRLSFGVFFIGGFVASSTGLLVPRLRLALSLDYAAATAVQLASHSSYLLFALPIAALVARHGYMRAHAAGLALIALGCVTLVAGFAARQPAAVMVALLTVSAGATVLQIASNTVATMVGDPARAAVRLNLLQGLNSLGTVLAPLVAAPFIAAPLSAGATLRWPGLPFGAAALVLALLALAFHRQRDLLRDHAGATTRTDRAGWRATWRDRRLLAGAGAIFAYVGAEVTIGVLLADFLMSDHAAAAAPQDAARFVALYWAGAMAGRFAGGLLMRRRDPAALLTGAALAAALLVGMAVGSHGLFAAAALIAVGLANSIMYPTIYVLALPRDPARAMPAATILCMAVVGGAIVPPATGLLADRIGLAPALLLPAACYLSIAIFAVRARR